MEFWSSNGALFDGLLPVFVLSRIQASLITKLVKLVYSILGLALWLPLYGDGCLPFQANRFKHNLKAVYDCCLSLGNKHLTYSPCDLELCG